MSLAGKCQTSFKIILNSLKYFVCLLLHFIITIIIIIIVVISNIITMMVNTP